MTSNNIDVIRQRQKDTMEAVKALDPFTENFSVRLKEKLKKNLLELASRNDYLLSTVEPKRIVKLAIDLTQQGLDINPLAKNVSIVPFDAKVDGKKVMLPQPIIHKKGWDNILFNGNFMIKSDEIWLVNGKPKEKSKMNYSELASIEDSNKKFREDFFLGWNVIVEDLQKELPIQKEFISYTYAKTATKNAKMPSEFELSGLLHKAIRKALNNMFIPDSRLTILDVEYTAHTPIVEQSVAKVEDNTNKVKEVLTVTAPNSSTETTKEDSSFEYTIETAKEKLNELYKQAPNKDIKKICVVASNYTDLDAIKRAIVEVEDAITKAN